MHRRKKLRGVLASAVPLLAVAAAIASSPASASAPAGSTGTTGPTGGTTATGTTGTTTPVNLLTPPPGEVFNGISGDDASQFTSETGKHPAVFGSFVTWGHSEDWAFNDAAGTHARVMLHIGTTMGSAGGGITPGAIAAGQGDSYLLQLAHTIAAHHQPVYIRLLPEMNNANNPYSADNLDGSARGPAYSHAAFISAWRRSVDILRGGTVTEIDAKLAALHLPAVQGVAPDATLPVSPIAFVWCPETAGTPNVPSESAASYWPGSAYVDWVGTDFYSAFPNFAGLSTFYNQYRGKPFVFAEWAMWESDSPGFVDEFFNWINSHKRVKMILYNEGYGSTSQLLLAKYPAAIDAIRTRLSASRFVGYASEWQPRTLGSTGSSGVTGGSTAG
ncbi:MAG: hypothetical protein ABSC56_04805 [Solirubrobacteraceae bacterium]|jgi:hypothetical protein